MLETAVSNSARARSNGAALSFSAVSGEEAAAVAATKRVASRLFKIAGDVARSAAGAPLRAKRSATETALMESVTSEGRFARARASASTSATHAGSARDTNACAHR